jgi:hypothetical protein
MAQPGLMRPRAPLRRAKATVRDPFVFLSLKVLDLTTPDRSTMNRMRLVQLLCGLGVFACGAFGGDKTNIQTVPREQAEQAPLWSFDLNSDYTSGSKIRHAEAVGSQAVYRYELEALRNIHLFSKYYLQFGVDYERFDFSRSNSVFPYAVSSLDAEINVSYWSGDELNPLLKLQPGVYFTRDHISANSFDFPVRVVGGYKIHDDLYAVLGADVDPFEEDPVTPICGFNWKINDQFNLRAVFPEPRFSYTPTKELEFFIDADFKGGGYRNGPTNDRRTSNAILDYTEYRGGGGISYTLKKGLSLEATVGWSIARRFDYFRAGPDFLSNSAPYLKLDLSIDLY